MWGLFWSGFFRFLERQREVADSVFCPNVILGERQNSLMMRMTNVIVVKGTSVNNGKCTQWFSRGECGLMI